MKVENDCNSGQFNDWYSQHYNSLYKFGQTKLDDDDQLKDLIQDTFLVALENIKTFRNQSSEKTWLMGILKRKIYLFYRRQNMKRKFAGEQIEIHAFQQTIRENISAVLNEPAENSNNTDFFNSAAEMVEDALLSLPDNIRNIFVKLYFEKQSVVSVCDEMKITAANLYVICYRGKDLLRKFFASRIAKDH